MPLPWGFVHSLDWPRGKTEKVCPGNGRGFSTRLQHLVAAVPSILDEQPINPLHCQLLPTYGESYVTVLWLKIQRSKSLSQHWESSARIQPLVHLANPSVDLQDHHTANQASQLGGAMPQRHKGNKGK